MKPASDAFLEDGRVVGRALRPHLATALADVERRRLTRARRRRRRGVRASMGALATLAVLTLAVPALGHRAPSAAAPVTPVAVAPAGASTELQPTLSLHHATVEPAASASTGSPASTPVAQDCAPGSTSLEMAFDRDVYAPGQVARVDLILRNNAPTACRVGVDPCRSGINITGPDGSTVYASGADPAWVCAKTATRIALAAGGVASLGFTWETPHCAPALTACPDARLAPGRYTVDASWAALEAPIDAHPRHLLLSNAALRS